MNYKKTLTPVLLLALFSLAAASIAAWPAKAFAGKPQPDAPQAPAAGPAGSIPAGLPSHLWLGLSSSPDAIDWMVSSNIPFDARYQYLTGGVNTSNDWTNWNTPRGQFATYYLNDSHAHGYMPVFTYYELLSSAPGTGGDEPTIDYNNLNNPSTMAAYYDNFAVLMQKCAAYGGPVVVHVEPDFWAYMQQRVRSGSNNAADITASVASSGYSGLSDLPNTVQGYAWALQSLRSAIAPNVILAIHASAWGGGRDVGLDKDPNLDVAAYAQAAANFLNSAGMNNNPHGARSWDLVFADPGDRDAAYYAQWDGGTHWWDETNATLPNFDRWRAWITGLNSGMQRRIVVWQIPLGNTIMRSENNTSGHWQDNRVQYWLGSNGAHLQSWIDAGVVGFLFGAGQGDQTYNTDHTGDGVTNPAPINNNNGVATVADDDGGYFRAQSAAYYNRGALPLDQGQATATPTRTTPGATATMTRTPGPGTPSATATRTATPSRTAGPGTPSATPTRIATRTATPCGVYSDVPADYWAYDFIHNLACKNIVSGYADGSFKPGANTTRAQLVKMVVVGMGWSTANPGQPIYRDANPNDWFYPFVQVAAQRGVISGYADGTFHPYANVTRGQLSKIVVSAKGWGALRPQRPTFSDVPASNAFYGFVEQAYAKGIISGYGATFLPNSTATRAQLSKILSLALAAPTK